MPVDSNQHSSQAKRDDLADRQSDMPAIAEAEGEAEEDVESEGNVEAAQQEAPDEVRVGRLS